MVTENAARAVSGEIETFVENGYLIVEDAFTTEYSRRALSAMTDLPELIRSDLGPKTYAAARDSGELELRLAFVYDEFFLSLLEHEIVAEYLDRFLPPPTILRYVNVEHHEPEKLRTQNFRNNAEFHWNYPRRIEPLCVLDLVAVFDDSLTNGLEIMPRSQHLEACPAREQARNLLLPPGSLLVFNPYLWHRETDNTSENIRRYIHMQFSRPFIKAHFDNVRALGEARVKQLSPRLKQLLGWNSRVPASLKEFYVEPEERLYKSGQW